MNQSPDYWTNVAQEIALESESAHTRGDDERRRSLNEARLYALELAQRLTFDEDQRRNS